MYKQIRSQGSPVKPMSVKNIRDVAQIIRRMLGIQDLVFCPITRILELLGTGFFPDYGYEIGSDDMPELKGTYAKSYPLEKKIIIKESVYNAACQGDPQARFTIAHEFGHLFLRHETDISFSREIHDTNGVIPAYRDSEWQADTFAAEFLMPEELVRSLSVEEICEQCGVSYTAAKTRRRKLNTTIWQ